MQVENSVNFHSFLTRILCDFYDQEKINAQNAAPGLTKRDISLSFPCKCTGVNVREEEAQSTIDLPSTAICAIKVVPVMD